MHTSSGSWVNQEKIPSSTRREGGLRAQGKFHKRSKPGEPLVTVITVVRNGIDLIDSTIRNVLAQTYTNIEYIVVDGASTDATVDVIRSHEQDLAYWVSEPDKGLYDAMNKGIALATGDWINFMNAGDAFECPESIALVAANMRADDDLLYGHCRMIFDRKYSVIWKAKDASELWKGMIFRHQSLFTRSGTCKRFLFDPVYTISADFAFILMCYRHGCRFRKLDMVISVADLGGLSDVNIVRALRQSRQAVMQLDASLKHDLYHRWLILSTVIKTRLKKIIPGFIVRRVRSNKYR